MCFLFIYSTCLSFGYQEVYVYIHIYVYLKFSVIPNYGFFLSDANIKIVLILCTSNLSSKTLFEDNIQDIFLLFSSISRPLTFMGSQTKRVLLTPLKHSARPFRVSNHDRSSRRGVMADSLKELLSKVPGATAPPLLPAGGPRTTHRAWGLGTRPVQR